MRKGLAVGLAMFSMALPSAQEPAFEVASVKVVAEANVSERFMSPRPGQFSMHGFPLSQLLPTAFGVPFQLRQVKFDFNRVNRDLLERTLFDIQAKGNPAGDQSAMMRALLRDRFGMKWHKEMRTVPLYTLTVKQPGKLGPWLKATTVNCQEFYTKVLAKDQGATIPGECNATSARGFGGMSHARSAGTVAELATGLQQFSDIPITDATGFKGNYSWDFAGPLVVGRSSPEFAVTLRDAVDDQLGLKLTRTTGPWEVIVIDDVRMPTPN